MVQPSKSRYAEAGGSSEPWLLLRMSSACSAQSKSSNRLGYSVGSARASEAFLFTLLRSSCQRRTHSLTLEGTYERAKKAASGKRPHSTRMLMHTSRLESRKLHRNATLVLPLARARSPRARTLSARPSEEYISSSPLRSFARSRHDSASFSWPECSARSPIVFHLERLSTSVATWSAVSRSPSCMASSNRYSGSVAIARASMTMPLPSRNCATPLSWSWGMLGSTAAAPSSSPLMTSVLYSMSVRRMVYDLMLKSRSMRYTRFCAVW
mmetsp:Transcript_8659/g.24425  ORF Transcript_8659/g.24425 Transcript_8659/m.24425 type:complete len:268 (-) Transcript_8659:487-1290(-)